MARARRVPSVSSSFSSADEAAPSPPPSPSQATPIRLFSLALAPIVRPTTLSPALVPSAHHPSTAHRRQLFDHPVHHPAGSFSADGKRPPPLLIYAERLSRVIANGRPVVARSLTISAGPRIFKTSSHGPAAFIELPLWHVLSTRRRLFVNAAE